MSKKQTKTNIDDWRLHDSYDFGVSATRCLTRSQTGFIRIKHSMSELELFADKSRHQPPGLPHLMSVMKGTYGSIPNTIVIRSSGKFLHETPGLIEALNDYKKYKPGKKNGNGAGKSKQ